MDPRKRKSFSTNERAGTEADGLSENLDRQGQVIKHHKKIGRGVLDAMYGDRKDQAIAWAENTEWGEAYERMAETIVENKDLYYIGGEKVWLASEGKYHTDSVSLIVDGFIDERLKDENEPWRNLRDKSPRGFEEFQNRLRVFVGKKMEDADFSLEERHNLKLRALQEFIHENGEFGRWATRGLIAITPNAYSDSVVRMLPDEIFRAEGFIQDEQEWEDVREAAKSALTNNLSFRRSPSQPMMIEMCYTNTRNLKVSEYKKIFNISVTAEELLATEHGSKAFESLTGRSTQGVLARLEEERRIMEELREEERVLRAKKEAEKKTEARRRREEERQLRQELERLQQIEDYPKRIAEGTDLYIMKGENGRKDIYISFVDPTTPPEGFEMTVEKREELREQSYFGLFEILLSEGRFAPGQEIRAHHRNVAANRYFETFNYGEHLDELNDYFTAKLEELHDDGRDNQAKLLKRRFRLWAQNEIVAGAFDEYRDLVSARERQAEDEPGANNVKIFRDASIQEVKQQVLDSIKEHAERMGRKFAYTAQSVDDGTTVEYGENDKTSSMPKNVTLERINALDQWAEFIRENIPDANLEEAAMVFDPRTDGDKIDISDGNAYAVIAFDYCEKRCMIAECVGVNGSGAAAGAMKIWMGDIGDRNGWERAFDKTKTEAANRELCASINHSRALVDEVMGRETDDVNYIVESEDVMFRLAFRYFESDGSNKDFLRNNAENRRHLAEFIGPQIRRPNAGE